MARLSQTCDPARRNPPRGSGSLSILVGSPAEKVAYGVSSRARLEELREVGFRVYTTGENISKGSGSGGSPNMPDISFEMDPNIAGIATDYTTLVWMPPDVEANRWSPYIDATQDGLWGFTGGRFNSPPTKQNCGIDGPRCTLAEVMALLTADDDLAQLITMAITKGRNYEFQGAVDDLRLNGRVADFEEGGVIITEP